MNGRPKLVCGIQSVLLQKTHHRQGQPHRVTGAAEVGMDDSPNLDQVTVMIGDRHGYMTCERVVQARKIQRGLRPRKG
jgi:hypothetical protein